MYTLNRYFFHRSVYLLSKSYTFPAAHVFLEHFALCLILVTPQFHYRWSFSSQKSMQHSWNSICVILCEGVTLFSFIFYFFPDILYFISFYWKLKNTQKTYEVMKISKWSSINQSPVKVEFDFFPLLMFHCVLLY